MGNTYDDFDIDIPDFDDFGDDGEGSFKPTNRASGKRKAITEFGGSFLSGIKKSLLSTQNQRAFLNKALPNSGYVKLFDAISVAKSNVEDVYGATAEELRKQTNGMKGPLKTLNKVYGDSKLVPKKIKKIIDGWETQSTGNTYNYADQIRQQMGEDLAAIFSNASDVQAAVAYQQKKTVEDATNKQLAVNMAQTKATVGGNQILNTISAGIERLNAYQDGITSRVQRKTIELMYRQYGVQRETLDTLQQIRAMQQKSFDALILNTGLPEAIKITNMELGGQMIKKQMWGMVTQRAVNNFKDIGSKITNHIKENLVGTISNIGSLATTGLDGLSMNAENQQLMDELNGGRPSRASRMGGYTAPVVSWLLRSQGAKWLNTRLKGNENVKYGSDRLLNIMGSAPGILNRVLEEGTGNGIFDFILNATGARDFAHQDNRRVRGSAIPDLDKQAFWNTQSQLALVEVIPGHLERMSQTLTKIYTRDDNAPLMRYDYETGKFLSSGEIEKRAFDRLAPQDRIKNVREEVEHMVNNLDRNKELSPKARRELSKYILKTAQHDMGRFDLRSLVSDDSPLPADVADEVARVLGGEDNLNVPFADQYNRNDPFAEIKGMWKGGKQYQERAINANDQVQRIRELLPQNMQTALDLARTGNIDLLERSGFVTRSSTGDLMLNRDMELSAYLGEASYSGPESNARNTTAPPGRKNRKNKRKVTGKTQYQSMVEPTTEQSTAQQTTPNYTIGHDALQSMKDELIMAIERNSSKNVLGVTNELLDAIRNRLEMGVPAGGAPSSPGEIRKKSGLFRKVMNGVSWGKNKTMNYLKWSYGTVIPNTVRMITRPFSFARDALARVGGARGIYDIGSKAVKNKVMDVYLKGKTSPVLEAAKIKAGEYYDQASGKVIKSLSDIKGAVVDRSGNIVLSVEDFKSGLYAIKNGKMVSLMGSVIRGAFGLLTGGLSAYVGAVGKVYKAAWDVSKWAVKKTLTLGFSRKEITQDVFVPGERSPRLRANLLKNGFYKNTDGTPIFKIKDVKGDILDAAGNVVLSANEIAQGLVDKHGEELKDFTAKGRTLVGRLTSLATGAVGMAVGGAWNLTKNIYKGYWKGIKGVGKGTRWGLGKLFGKKKTSSAVGSDIHSFTAEIMAHQADRLDNIYDLLNERLPKTSRKFTDLDGDGFREGSRESWFAKLQRERKGDKETPKEKEKDDKPKGLIGLLMAAVSGIGGLLGTVKAWGSNMFGLMRATALMRAGGSLLGGIGSLFGGLRGKGRAVGALAGAGRMGRMAKLGNFVSKSGLIKGLAFTAATAGLMAGFSGLTNAAELASSGKILSSSESGAIDAVNKIAGASAGGSDGGSSGGSGQGGGKDESLWWDNLRTSVMGSIGGEALAIGGAMGATKLYDMYRKKKNGDLPVAANAAHGGHKPIPGIGKVGNFLLQNKYGRLLTAGVTGAGLYAGSSALFGDSKDRKDLGTETAKSTAVTLGLDAAALAAPWAIAKGMDWYRNRKEMRTGVPATGPVPRPTPPSTPRTPATIRAIQQAVPANTAVRAPLTTAAHTAAAVQPAVATAARTGLGGIARKVGGSVMRHVGPLGLGIAALDAATTEGNAWDKAKAFGSSAAGWYAASKGISLASRGLSLAKNAITNPVTRMVAGTALRGAASAAIPLLTNPIVLGALAVAGVGYLAYKGYQRWFKKDKAALTRFRMAQYGYALDKDEVKCKTILALEEVATKHVRVFKERAAFTKSMDAKKVLAMFGIDPTDHKRTQLFAEWFNGRFKPVFMRSIWAAKMIGKKADLTSIDDMGREEKLSYLQSVNGVTGTPFPYDIMVSPFTDERKVRYNKDEVASAYEKAVRDVKKEKTKARREMEEKAEAYQKEVKAQAEQQKELRKGTIDNQIDEMKKLRDDTQRQLDEKAKSGSLWDKAKATAYSGWNTVASSSVGKWVTRGAIRMGMVGGDPKIPFKGTADQKKYQLMVYKAFINAGFSDAQSRILTAEVGRENSYNPNHLFGGHADPHRGSNMGMISWQDPRRRKLIAYLKQQNALAPNGTIKPDQNGLNAQAKFIMMEMQSGEGGKQTRAFLANKNIDYRQGAYIIGKFFIRWRIDDPKYQAQGIKNRDGFYAMLNQQLGNQKVAPNGPTSKNTTNPAAAGGAKVPPGQFPGMLAAGRGMGAPPLVSGGKLNVPTVGSVSPSGMVTRAGAAGGLTTGSVPSNHRAVKAATIATQRAAAKSKGLCARYVADALQMAGYKFTRQVSAYMYATNGVLASAGFKNIANNGNYQIGDILVYPAHGRGNSGGATHGHIQIFNGRNWVSDFVQRSVVPGASYNGVRPTLWRDATIIGKAITGSVSVKGAAPSDTTVETTTDSKSPAAKTAKPTTGTSTGTPRSTGTPSANAVAKPTVNAYGQPIGVTSTAAPRAADMAATASAQAPVSPANPSVSRSTQRQTEQIAQATQQRQTEEQLSRNNELVNIANEQLVVQKQMASALNEIRDILKSKPTQQSSQPTQSNSPDLLNRSKTVQTETPVSMSVKR